MSEDVAERTPAQWRQIALHEGAHATVAWLLEIPVEYVSLRPGEHFGGVIALDEWPYPPHDSSTALAVLQPWAYQDHINRSLLHTVAGNVGGTLDGRLGGALADIDDGIAFRAAHILGQLAPLTRGRVDAVERKAIIDDEAAALTEAGYLRGNCTGPPSLVDIHRVNLARAEARQMLDDDHPRHYKAVVDALLDRIILTGDELDEVLRPFPCPCHAPPWRRPRPIRLVASDPLERNLES